MPRILLRAESEALYAELNESRTALSIAESLPAESTVNTWGEEIYFTIPEADTQREEGTLKLEVGDVAFWPEGNCLCVFFGRTPASTKDEPVPASEVIIVGKVTEGLEKLGNIRDGEKIEVKMA